jgi:hypothetical protein
LVPALPKDLIRNLGGKFLVPTIAISTVKNILMTITNDKDKYRQYAAECRRLAAKSSAKDKAILLEIADAWIACAEAAERSSSDRTNGDGPSPGQ